ncbi:glutamate-ammonia-ligase adenylyltransferase [Variibacter gotjawalensis]|uniref:Bifunctional glutamine synthetase adenylyltransferase/adenylyl-removing enzyme n=1 Tax=Variibacter gotjawalensis TaxID=1333996 RepID=A0A0S3PZ81_9BRAD|nr:bifunctional [glutamine synthetase] adenylyltransferase/[glutamine synthetase]-adenylyl-L-tyrosine phosphorylase [Variibacter gotjawalensis]NIK47040.1 glutamate-ammonia-ligase adenylyltransferase [Variibacter gotjawalensis]RZS48945.1 glutamate-ammonia-ligase adenylyltransferase [Variibacter gotjawalensis]BAT61203.1 glutamate-ammonia-ligase adenylyltransferase [Variibacter gotjawalensis]
MKAKPSPKSTKKPLSATETLISRFTRAPKVADDEAMRRRMRDWDKARSASRKELKALLDEHPLGQAMVEGIAGGSPYLWDLVNHDADRLLRALNSDPDARFVAILAEAKQKIAKAEDEADATSILRHMKAEAALLIALADIGGAWIMPRVTHALTELADMSITLALRFLLGEAVRKKKMRAPDPARPEVGSGYIVLAMGKMGGFELNYSSDIDLICLYDADACTLVDRDEAAPFFVRLTRNLAKMLQERTVDGYVFRVDLRLRPDPGLTQIALSTGAALGYYESVGLNWERQALIKARPCAGDIPAGDAFLKALTPFIWRKYLDYAAIADVQAMKQQIHSFRGHDEIAVEGHNIKLGRGGIREIEFFAQTQQLIAGGRHPELRGRETLEMLDGLTEGGWIKKEARDDMREAYIFLRGVEHRLQMMNDEQTHSLPSDPAELNAFSRFLGYEDRDAFATDLLKHLRKVQRHYGQLFEGSIGAAPGQRELAFPAERDDRETLDRLVEMGFKRALEVSGIVRGWFAAKRGALRGELAQSHLKELVPVFLSHISRAEDPDGALQALDKFLQNLHGGARLLSLLRQNPSLVSLLALILGISPRLADALSEHPGVMDALIDPAFFGALPDDEKLTEMLRSALGDALSYEDFLDRIRLFKQEQVFLLGTRILSGTLPARQAGQSFAELADVLVREVDASITQRFIETHGRVKGQETAVIAMGKLGGREMTMASDLDLILVYDFAGENAESDGTKPLYGSQYFSRLTQRLIAALTAQTNYGALYPVDMRLRPSGRSGPVATKLDAFEAYQKEEAWTWEHMALTRARVLSSSPKFTARVNAAIAKVLQRKREASVIAADVLEMREAIAAEKGESDRWDLKTAAGGLIDIEFIAQYLQLVHAHKHPGILDTATAGVLEKALRLGVLPLEHAEVLRPAITLYQDLTQVLRLYLVGSLFDPKTATSEPKKLLARAADLPDFATLDAHLIETQRKVRETFRTILETAISGSR